MEQLLELDRKLFLELNGGYRHAFLDQLMTFLTTTYAWIPLYLLLVYLMLRTYRSRTWVWLAAIGLTILLADQITSSVMKPLFERLRPSRDPIIADQVFIVNNYRGGKFGFASSHAANTFGIATLMWLILRRYRPWIGLMFLWTLLVGYTRIYLGVHYPGDILAGFLVGFACALLAYYLAMAGIRYLDKEGRLSTGPD